MLGPSYHVKNEKVDLTPGGSEHWFDPRRGSDKVFLKALGDLANRTGHPEVATVPWVLWGHSGGGIWADVMASLHPERVVAVWMRSGSTPCSPGVPSSRSPNPRGHVLDPHDVQSRGEGKGYLDPPLETFKDYRAGEHLLVSLPIRAPAMSAAIQPLPGHSVPRRLPGHAAAGPG